MSLLHLVFVGHRSAWLSMIPCFALLVCTAVTMDLQPSFFPSLSRNIYTNVPKTKLSFHIVVNLGAVVSDHVLVLHAGDRLAHPAAGDRGALRSHRQRVCCSCDSASEQWRRRTSR